jgi:hypothetical protein
VAVRSGTQALGVDAGKRQPRQPEDGKTRGLTEAVNLPVLPLFQGDLEPRLVFFEAKAMHLGGPRGSAVDLDGLLPAVEVFVVHQATDLGHVDLGGGRPRVEETIDELSVVGEEQRSTRMKVEATDGDDTLTDPLHVFGYRWTPLGIVHRAHDVSGLVEHQVNPLLCGDPAAVELDHAGLWIGTSPELRDDAAVHGHATGRDQRFGLSP